jgi:hypothetical protein
MDLREYNAVLGSTAAEFAETGLTPLELFPWQIVKMNTMYSLPINEAPTLDGLNESPVTRMAGFLKTFRNEISEGLDIQAYLIVRDMINQGHAVTVEVVNQVLAKLNIVEDDAAKLEGKILALVQQGDADEFDRQVLVMLADWFGDMVVYIRSEALKYGIPLESVLACIMGSNFTKLGEDGQPIKDANGKVQKGPNFRPPEQHIYATMFEQEALLEQASVIADTMNELNAIALPVLTNPIAGVFPQDSDYDDLDFDDDDAGHDETFALPTGDVPAATNQPLPE